MYHEMGYWPAVVVAMIIASFNVDAAMRYFK